MSAPPEPRAAHASHVKSQKISVLFEDKAPDLVEATLAASEPESRFEGLKRSLFGSPIPLANAKDELLNRAQALAILSSDALSSVAYGTEASLAVLVAAGLTTLHINLWIGIAIVILMAVVAFSYRQTIHAYPGGGGSYIVASDNLSPRIGLIAAAALLIDYLLTVSVSVAAGIDAIASALPVLQPWTLLLDLAAILLITYINMRGVRDAGRLFAIPTYVFLGSFALMIVFGVGHAFATGGLFIGAPPGTADPHVLALIKSSPGATAQTLSLLLVLTAFASGCSAMTGVEAISNGVPVFKGAQQQDQANNAAQTLVIMIILLIGLFLGTTYLAWRLGALPSPTGQPTVTSQIATVAYAGVLRPMYYVVQFATFAILIFAANTSYADFPRLCAILARDGYMPVLFQYRGERIAFNAGIGMLAALSAVVLVIFKGQVTALINLYALGVFTAFTLSQAGMVVHWRRRRQEDRGWRHKAIINSIGATTTGIVALVIAITKFDRGGFVVVILVPLLVLLFTGIHNYYLRPRQLHPEDIHDRTPCQQIIIPILTHKRLVEQATIDGKLHARHRHVWPRLVNEEIAIALTFEPAELLFVCVVFTDEEADEVRRDWQSTLAEISQRHHIEAKLKMILSPFRTVVQPIAKYIHDYSQDLPDIDRIGVMIPHQEKDHIWEKPLRRFAAERIRRVLKSHPHDNLKIIDLPYTVGK